jgi:hypothetical protein
MSFYFTNVKYSFLGFFGCSASPATAAESRTMLGISGGWSPRHARWTIAGKITAITLMPKKIRPKLGIDPVQRVEPSSFTPDRQPQQLSAKTLMRKASRLPTDWTEQRTLLGF